jgi:predicted lysophospholipase L1 biosynthesis ABC-type transport system permease subunit
VKESMPCKYALSLLILAAVSLVLLVSEEFVIGMVLLGAVAFASVIIGESQFWVEKELKREAFRPESSYKDYVTLCKRNGREILSPVEWCKYVRLVY